MTKSEELRGVFAASTDTKPFDPNNLVEITNLVPVESELRKAGFVPVIEYCSNQGPEGKPSHVRIKDRLYKVWDVPEDDPVRQYATVYDFQKLLDVTVFTEDFVNQLIDTLDRITAKIPFHQVGEQASNKTYSFKMACALINLPMIRFNGSRETDREDIFGAWQPKAPEPLIKDLREFVKSDDFKTMKQDSQDLINRVLAVVGEEGFLGLSEWQWRRIQALEGMTEIFKKGDWEYRISDFGIATELGAFLLVDESYTIPGNLREGLNPLTEWNPSYRYKDITVRLLSKKEKEEYERTGYLPAGLRPLHERFGMGFADNPEGMGADREGDTAAAKSRKEFQVVYGMKLEDLQAVTNFFVFGENPDIGPYRGLKGMRTPYNDIVNEERFKDLIAPIESLAKMPNARGIMRWLPKFQQDISSLIDDGVIGDEIDQEGGSDVFTIRTIEHLFEHIILGLCGSRLQEKSIIEKGSLKVNSSWYDAVMAAVEKSYLHSFPKKDREILMRAINASGLKQLLGPSGKEGVNQTPEWVRAARDSGANIAEDLQADEFRMSFADIYGIGYDASKKTEAKRRLLGILNMEEDELVNLEFDELGETAMLYGVWMLDLGGGDLWGVEPATLAEVIESTGQYICRRVEGGKMVVIPKVVRITRTEEVTKRMEALRNSRENITTREGDSDGER